MTKKKKASYRLADIQAAFTDPDKLNRTFVAKQGADDLDMDNAAVAAVIHALAASDFDESMNSFQDHKLWQDLYRPIVDGKELYVKFTIDAQKEFLLISFKEA